MTRRPLALALLVTVLGGCTHEHVLDSRGGPPALRAANELTSGRGAEVVAIDGRLFRWHDVVFGPDSISGLGPGADPLRRSVAAPRVSEVRVRSRSRGAAEGAAIGVPLGVIVGLALRGMFEATFCSDSSYYTCEETSTARTVLGGIGAGAMWGAIIGLVRSSRTTITVR